MLSSIVYSLPKVVCSRAVQNKDRKVVDHFIPKGLIFGHSNLEPLSPQPVSTLKKIPAFPSTPHPPPTHRVSDDLPKSQ